MRDIPVLSLCYRKMVTLEGSTIQFHPVTGLKPGLSFLEPQEAP